MLTFTNIILILECQISSLDIRNFWLTVIFAGELADMGAFVINGELQIIGFVFAFYIRVLYFFHYPLIDLVGFGKLFLVD